MSFSSLGVSGFLLKTLSSVSISEPTEVQKACIPKIIEGSNIIGVSKTGSGKTAAFLLPIITKLSKDPFGIYAVILTPTRELAFQIGEQVKLFGEGINVKFTMVVGGQDMMLQSIQLKQKPHIIICTPGRLADHLRSSQDALSLNKIKFLVLDEADRLLEDTFVDDMELILSKVPEKRQTLLFTATMTDSLKQLQGNSFVFQSSADSFEIVQKLNYKYILCPSSVKDAHLVWYLKNFPSKSVIIFTSKRNTANRLTKTLNLLEIPAVTIHSELAQGLRTENLDKFRTGTIQCLVSTGVVSRGVDIPTCELVINYDIPSCVREFIHRSGRTARAGRGGICLSMVGESDVDVFLEVEKAVGKSFDPVKIEEDQVNNLVKEVAVAKREAIIETVDEKTKLKLRKRYKK